MVDWMGNSPGVEVSYDQSRRSRPNGPGAPNRSQGAEERMTRIHGELRSESRGGDLADERGRIRSLPKPFGATINANTALVSLSSSCPITIP
jgi:hypothetical protein